MPEPHSLRSARTLETREGDYDAHGIVTTASDTAVTWTPGGLIQTFTYDALDRVDTVTAHYIPGATTVLLDADYDRFGNRDALTLTDGSGALVHQWAYDRKGRLVAACLPQDQATPTQSCVPAGPTQTLGFLHGGTDAVALDERTAAIPIAAAFQGEPANARGSGSAPRPNRKPGKGRKP